MSPDKNNTVLRMLTFLALWAMTVPALATDWLPIAPEDLAMTGEAMAPKASAIYLYRQVDRDDGRPMERRYERIKVLTEDGRGYANVKILFDKRREAIRNIDARTVRPDGSIIPFNGTIYEEPVLEARGVRLLAKAFTMPDVQAGSIIEYRYERELPFGYVYDSHWILSEKLFTRDAKFSFRPYRGFGLRYSWPQGLPPGTAAPIENHGTISMEVHDVPAFVTEEYAPPEDELKFRVDFVYISGGNEEKDPDRFWKKFDLAAFRDYERFVDEPRAMQRALAQIVSGGDSAEQKLRKIYARVQQVRNLSFERRKSEQEADREHQRDIADVADVWRLGYGTAEQINSLFAGLARAAGIQADTVLISTRDRYFFAEKMLNPGQLNTTVVLVTSGGKESYLDPGTPFAPFGVLPWPETGVRGLRLARNGGAWVATPRPLASEARLVRKAELRLSPSGALAGRVTVTYLGLEALSHRLAERDEDDTSRRQYLEEQLQADLAGTGELTLINAPDWLGSDPALVAEFDISIPGWAAVSGQRALMPAALFGAGYRHMFEHATRVHPLYFSFPYETEDDVRIELPAGWRLSGTPATHDTDLKNISYRLATEDAGGMLQTRRSLRMNLLLVYLQYYDSVRGFFQTVRTGDEEQLVIATGAVPARK